MDAGTDGAEAIEHEDWVAKPDQPMTEATYLTLTPKPGWRTELIDGGLLLIPAGDLLHQDHAFRLYRELDRELPDELHIFHEANVRLGPDRLIVPDVVVATGRGDSRVLPAADVVLAAEVVSPSSAAVDRILKPRLGAEAGIPWYLRVERDPDLHLQLWRRHDDTTYELHVMAAEGHTLEIPKLGTIEVDALHRRRG